MSQNADAEPSPEQKGELQGTIEKLECRPISNPEINQQISEGYKLLGDSALSV